MQNAITDDLEALLGTLPPGIHNAVNRLENRSELLEIVMDLGRLAEGRFPEGEVILSTQPVTSADLEYVVERIGEFGDDNRAGIERTLHRISALRNRKGKVVGLTCRIGRAVLGSIGLIRDIVEQGQSILILGRPGVGKTTLLREIARVLADEANKRVVVVDTSNEIAGDGDIPHPGIGRARRMQVARTVEQHAVMIEAVENHMPQVIVIDEIGTELEAAAARTIAERGVQLVATAHGNSLGNLLVNPTLSDLVGGIQTVTLGDEEARRRHTQKSILERKAPPTFDVVVEQESWQELIVHRDVADTVDSMLRGQAVMAEERTRDEETGRVSVRRITAGGMDVPTWGVGGFGPADFRQGPPGGLDRSGRGDRGEWGQLRHMTQGQQSFRSSGGGGGLRGRSQAAPQFRALAPTGTSPADFEHQTATAIIETEPAPITEGVYVPAEVDKPTPVMKTLRVYPFGVSRDRLTESARKLHVPIIVTNNQGDADAVITLKNYYRRQPERLQQAEQDRKLIIIQTAELAPANAYVRRLQHQMATRYNLISRSRGKEPNRRVKIFRSRD